MDDNMNNNMNYIDNTEIHNLCMHAIDSLPLDNLEDIVQTNSILCDNKNQDEDYQISNCCPILPKRYPICSSCELSLNANANDNVIIYSFFEALKTHLINQLEEQNKQNEEKQSKKKENEKEETTHKELTKRIKKPTKFRKELKHKN